MVAHLNGVQGVGGSSPLAPTRISTSNLPLEVITHNQGTISLEEDLERVRAVRKAIGKDIYLMVDANNSWTPSIAIKMG